MAEIPVQQGEAHKKGFDIGGLFGKKHEVAGPSVSDVLMRVNEMARRIKLVESRSTDLNRKVEVNEKNMLNERKRVIDELKTNDLDTLEIKRELNTLKSQFERVLGELKNFAAKEDIQTIKKYVDLWEPVNFVTRDEVEKIVKEALEEK